MISLSSLKPFLPLLLTFVLPRALKYYRVLKTAIRTRPPSRPLPDATRRGLNVLFASICFFLYFSLPSRATGAVNVFSTTNSRLHIATDVLFSRLAMLRPQGTLTAVDETLRSKLTTPISRQLYLRFGPETLTNCSFCQPEDDVSYLLYHLPTNVLLQHLINLLSLGLATSEGLAGFEARQWRKQSLIGAVILAVIDIYLTCSYVPHIDLNMPSPSGLFWQAQLLRPIAICFFELFSAIIIYASATNKFLLFTVAPENDAEVAKRQQIQQLGQTNIALQMATTKIRAFSVARNATVRQPTLKIADDEYWRAVVGMEGPSGVQGVWDDEEVQAAIARSLGSGNVDVTRMEREADAFIANITRGLDAAG